MKRYLIAFFVLVSSVAVSQDIANHSIPIGGGPTAQGWKTGGPCAAGQTLVWSSAAVDPTCTSVSGSGSTPGGSSGDIQYNNAGTFGGVPLGTGLANSGTAINCTNGTAAAKGCLQTDGATIPVSSGVISCRTGTASVLGCLQADGTTITVSGGVISAAPQTGTAVAPGGRLVMNDASCGTIDSIQLRDIPSTFILCYVPHNSNRASVAGVNYTFSTLGLDMHASFQLANAAYDIWGVVVGGNFRVCIGVVPWPDLLIVSLTSRNIVKGADTIYKNSATVTQCYNGASNLGAFTAGNATYLGSVFATGNGLTSWVLNPTPATGGTANVMGLYNVNRVRTQAVEREARPNWFYQAATWRCVNGNCNNKIVAIDGLGLSRFEIDTLMTIDAGDANVNGGTTNVCIDCAPADTPGSGPLGGLTLQVSNQAGFNGTSQGQTLAAKGFYTGMGVHVFTFLEIGGGGTATEWFGNTFSGMYVTLEN